MESIKNIELWNDCFESMTENEYDSKSLGELEDIYKDWLQERALKYKELLSSSEHVKQAIKDIGDFSAYYSGLESKAEAYDEMKQTPNLPDDYAIFLVYFARNKGDFHKTVHVLTDEGRCSLECMEWFAMMLGISWEPDWR